MNLIYASGALKKFLDARASGASESELKALALQAADEAARPNQPEARARTAPHCADVIDLDRARAGRSPPSFSEKDLT